MSDNNKLSHIDVNSAKFYHIVQDEIDSDLARMKKSLEILKKMRLQVAEMEVETAALYHANVWRNLEELKIISKTIKDNMNLNEIN